MTVTTNRQHPLSPLLETSTHCSLHPSFYLPVTCGPPSTSRLHRTHGPCPTSCNRSRVLNIKLTHSNKVCLHRHPLCPPQVSPPSVCLYRTVFAEALGSGPGLEQPSHRTDEDQFVKFFLELPRDVDLSRCPKPELVDNPFAELEGAQNTGMLEAQISARMVSLSSFIYHGEGFIHIWHRPPQLMAKGLSPASK